MCGLAVPKLLALYTKTSRARRSGGEREFEYEKIKSRIERKGIDLKAYEIYLQFAQKGLFPSAGFGMGIERLTRYICGIQQIAKTRVFAKLPGILGL
jgi:asparaginyl-tRNA synthetase